MNKIKFVKMHGTGNDFVLVEKENLEGVDPVVFAKDSSRRNFGAGSDGLLVVENSSEADICMRMYNPDGSEAMCGNGIRCFGKYVYEQGLISSETIRVETIGGIKILDLTVRQGIVESIRVDMGEPVIDRDKIPVAGTEGDVPILDHEITSLDRTFYAGIVSMGNPHCVIIIDEMSKDDVVKYGAVIETDSFFPERVNTEFVKVLGRDHLSMQVFERGAGYTLSCGTGACAAAVIARLKGLTDAKVTVSIPGGDLELEYSEGEHVFMSGPAAYVYEGMYYYNNI